MNLARATVVLVGLLTWAVLPTRAESPVNLSGTWELDRSRSVFPPRVTALPPGDLTLVIAHNGETLKIERIARMMGMHRSTTSIYYTDGRESSNPTFIGQTVVSRTHWDGASIVTVSKRTVTLDGKLESVETTDVNHLSEGGKVLVIDTTVRRAGQDPPDRISLVFVRK